MKDKIISRMRINGKTLRISQPKESINFEEFIKAMKPVLMKMAKKAN